MPAPSAAECSSCPLWRAVASSATSTTEPLFRNRHTSARDGTVPKSEQAEFVAHLAQRARDDPDWWLVVRAYAEGAHMFPDPFKPKAPPFSV